MKKFRLTKIILLIMTLGIIIGVDKVSAATDFYEYNSISTSYTNWQEVMLSPVLTLDDGYIIFDNSDSGNGKLTLKKISLDGKTTLWSNTYENYGEPYDDSWTSMILINDDYFIVASTPTGVLKMKTSDGSVVKTLSIDSNEIYQVIEYNDNYVVFWDTGDKYSDYLTVIDSDFNVKKTISGNDYNEVWFNSIGSDDDYIYVLAVSGTSDSTYLYDLLVIDSSYNVTVKKIANSSSAGMWANYGYMYWGGKILAQDGTIYYVIDDVSKIECTSDSCSLTYVDGYYGSNTSNKIYNSGAVYKDYIILGGHDDSNDIGFVEIYDSNLNLLETIEIDEGVYDVVKSITATDDGFVVKGIYDDNSCTVPTSSLLQSSEETLYYEEVSSSCGYGYKFIKEYKLPYNIETVTDGNGTITSSVVTSKSGEVVQFTVTPNEGYQLKLVTVTTSNGETITFTDYTFTMPSADVTIYAEFELITNPNTGISIPYITMGAFMIIGAGLFVIIRKKKYL